MNLFLQESEQNWLKVKLFSIFMVHQDFLVAYCIITHNQGRAAAQIQIIIIVGNCEAGW